MAPSLERAFLLLLAHSVLPVAPSKAAVQALVTQAGLPPPRRVVEMTAGFCNSVYKVELEDSTPPVVVKLFSPLAKLRLPPPHRGLADELAGQCSLGPRLLHRSSEGLVASYVLGRELSEADVHAPTALDRLIPELAERVASLHAVPPPTELADGVMLWRFLERMLSHIASAPETLPDGISLPLLEAEVERMRERFEALDLDVVYGHGDLKPSNVIASAKLLDGTFDGAAADDLIQFIDFELGGLHFRGYDLFKLFRTSGPAPSAANREAFLATYAAAAASPVSVLRAEAAAFEPLSWLEAALFFFFAIRECPDEAHRWRELAAHRWGKYLETRHLISADGDACRALLAVRG